MAKKVNAPTLEREQAKRLDQAIEMRGFSVPKVAKRAGLNRDIVDDILRGNGVRSQWGVAIAGALGIDPRWLILGTPSAAGQAARSLILFAGDVRLKAREKQELASFLAAWSSAVPEPDKGLGVCRYCLCTDAPGGGDCTWVDEPATICSACLEPEDYA